MSQPAKRKLPDWTEGPNTSLTAATLKKTKKKKGLFIWYTVPITYYVFYTLTFQIKKFNVVSVCLQELLWTLVHFRGREFSSDMRVYGSPT